MRSRRVWLVSLYVLATAVAQGLHDHGPRTSGAAAVGLPSCDDPRPHYAGHYAPEVLRGDLHCLACQFRAEHQADHSTWTVLPVPSRPLTALAVEPHRGRSPVARSTCRAPPLS